MTTIVIDPFNLRKDPGLGFIAPALQARKIKPRIQHMLDHWIGPHIKLHLNRIEVLRHTPGQGCLLEFQLSENRPHLMEAPTLTLLGRTCAKGLNTSSHTLTEALWNHGFHEGSPDGISIIQSLGMIPDFKMQLQQNRPGHLASNLLPDAQLGPRVARRIADAAYKLHTYGVRPRRRYSIYNELDELYQQLTTISQTHPHCSTRIERIITGCRRISTKIPIPERSGILRNLRADEILVDGNQLYLTNLDGYSLGDPAVDIGHCAANIMEQALRQHGHPYAMAAQHDALVNRYLELAGCHHLTAIEIYTTLSLARHIHTSTRQRDNQVMTECLIDLCQQRLATHASHGVPALAH